KDYAVIKEGECKWLKNWTKLTLLSSEPAGPAVSSVQSSQKRVKMLSLLKKEKKKSAVTISASKMNLDSTTAMTLCRTRKPTQSHLGMKQMRQPCRSGRRRRWTSASIPAAAGGPGPAPQIRTRQTSTERT